MKSNSGVSMKERVTSRNHGISYFWILGYVLLSCSYVKCSDEGCPGGEEWVLSRRVLETVLSWMPEQMKNPDDICASRFGPGSSLCREEYGSNYSRICEGVWCRDPLLDTCTPLSSQDGIQCGDQKWCYGGSCRYSELATVVSDSCPFGDNKQFSLDGLSCDQLVSRDRKQCYNDVIEQACCGSCAVAALNQAGCPYGDRLDECQENACFLMTLDELNRCCQTCGAFIEVVPTRRPEITVSPSISVNIRTTQSSRSTNRFETTQRRDQTPSASTSTPSQNPQSPTVLAVSSTTAETPQSSTDTETSRRTTASVTSTASTTTQSAETSETVQEQTTETENSNAGFEAQQDTVNDVAIGTGVGVGALVVIVVVVIIVYVIKKRIATSGTLSHQPDRGGSDTMSVGGESSSSMTASMMGASSSWYPSYRTTHPIT